MCSIENGHKKLGRGWGDSTAGEVLAWHVADRDLVPGTAYGFLSTARGKP